MSNIRGRRLADGAGEAARRQHGAGDGGPVIEATGLTKTYRSPLPFVGRDVEVLTGVDVAVRPGEILGIVGENGSGKSTLMAVLVGALQPDGGTITRSASIGWCPQDVLLYERLTVRETFELFGDAYGLDDATVRSRRTDLADKLGFTEYLDYRIDHLSGGNRQKVNLAVALLHDPGVLLLDEPYTGFDWGTYLAFWELTETLVDGGTAIAIISHLLSDRDRFDRILELEDGDLRPQDPPSEGPKDAR